MQTVNQRVILVFAATLAATAAGVLGGFLLAKTVVLRLAEVRLANQAARSLKTADDYGTDVRKALAAMNASTYPYCSERELTYFRHILVSSRYLRDGGRMNHGRIDCSTTLAHDELPQERFTPVYAGDDGFQVYWDLPPFRNGREATSVLQAKTSYVNTTIQIRSDGLPPEVTLKLTLRNPHGQPASLAKDGAEKVFTEDGLRREGGKLFATTCSNKFRHCMTAGVSRTDVFRIGRPMFTVCMGLMGLAAGGLGLFGSLSYSRERTLEQRLRRAIRRDELCMVYQPVVDLDSGRVVGAEALARWTDNKGLAVAPNVFIPVAEEHGFVGEVTQLAMLHVQRDLGELLRRDPAFRVSVNVTAWDLNDDKFLPMLEAAQALASVPSKSLTIEITESSTVNHEKAIEAIRKLRAAGHQVHIDDFGTGYSSLSYLHDLSVDAIKIDKAFTRAIGTGSVAVSILPQVFAMADALDLKIVVEGIETEEQARYFAASGRKILGQGWFFGRPMAAEKFLNMLAQEKERNSRLIGAVASVCEEDDTAGEGVKTAQRARFPKSQGQIGQGDDDFQRGISLWQGSEPAIQRAAGGDIEL